MKVAGNFSKFFSDFLSVHGQATFFDIRTIISKSPPGVNLLYLYLDTLLYHIIPYTTGFIKHSFYLDCVCIVIKSENAN